MATHSIDYAFQEIEAHWQAYWDEDKTFRAEDFSTKPKFYALDMFPYPSGAGLHVGHPEGWTANDILSRYKMAKGFNVLHPMGWDAFGLPAEQYAIKTGTHPRETTAANIDNFRRQIKAIGFAMDWDREVNTTDPNYYRWTQWIFVNLFQKGLAYVDERPVWWCPALGTVLANEEVIDGKSERGEHPVERRALRQWVLRITQYADRLLDGLDSVDWPTSTKKQQADWIGRSTGAEVTFAVDGLQTDALTIYTTRPDTLFGATYMVLAPEHRLVDKIVSPAQREAVEAYRREAAQKSDLDRTDLAKSKTGIFTGAFAVNPVNGARIPIWVADYVLVSYGTGAIMAVPAHDERDYEFAQAFDLPIIPVIEKPHSGNNGHGTDLPFTGDGVMKHSDAYSGMDNREAAGKIVADLERRGCGKAAVNYKLRDWLFSRQRYWGEPFPIIWVDDAGYSAIRQADGALAAWLPDEPVTYEADDAVWYAVPAPPEQLPVALPETENFKPSGDGESPLANCTDWVNVVIDPATGETRPANGATDDGWIAGRRETNTMPQWAGSCWYYLRYCDPANAAAPISPEHEAYWGCPDIYIGGKEHAVLHLLYARFWHQFLFDIGVVTTPEPFQKLFHQGIILGEDNQKMSKSRGNVVNPDDIIGEYGADALRIYEMFMGPLEDMKPWSMGGIEGVARFLRKVWRLCIADDGSVATTATADSDPEGIEKLLHQTVAKVSEDIENLRFNTAISQMMIFVNGWQKGGGITTETAKTFIQLLAPFAPHIGEELWERLGGEPSVSAAPWPAFDPAKLVSDEVKVVFQVMGKVRGDAVVAKTATQEEVLKIAKAHERVAPHIAGKTIRKVIYVPGKILNIVAN